MQLKEILFGLQNVMYFENDLIYNVHILIILGKYYNTNV